LVYLVPVASDGINRSVVSDKWDVESDCSITSLNKV